MIATEVADYPAQLTGASGSRLLAGNTSYAEGLEAFIARYHGAEAALLFNSGYDANVGLFSSLPQKGDTIICDELIHASIIDGARLSFGNRYTFTHNDVDALEAKLQAAKGNCYVVIESVYSMDGDSAPLAAIAALTAKNGAALIVDEAHAVGLYPFGLVQHLGLQDSVFARVVTFGKALGCHGAGVLGSNLLRNYLINFARSFTYTTAAPFHSLAAVKCAYELLQQADDEINRLNENIQRFKQAVNGNNKLDLIASDSAIQCVILGSNARARSVAQELQVAGLDVRPILSPTVPAGSERIRICLHAFNSAAEIDLLTSTLNLLADA